MTKVQCHGNRPVVEPACGLRTAGEWVPRPVERCIFVCKRLLQPSSRRFLRMTASQTCCDCLGCATASNPQSAAKVGIIPPFWTAHTRPPLSWIPVLPDPCRRPMVDSWRADCCSSNPARLSPSSQNTPVPQTAAKKKLQRLFAPPSPSSCLIPEPSARHLLALTPSRPPHTRRISAASPRCLFGLLCSHLWSIPAILACDSRRGRRSATVAWRSLTQQHWRSPSQPKPKTRIRSGP